MLYYNFVLKKIVEGTFEEALTVCDVRVMSKEKNENEPIKKDGW